MKFDFDSESSEAAVKNESVPPKKSFGFGKQKNSTIEEIADEEDEDEDLPAGYKEPKSDDDDMFSHGDTLSRSNRLFMHT